MPSIKKTLLVAALSIMGATLPALSHAEGMVPETSVVLINEADGEAAIKVKNTDAKSGLLYTIIEHIPEDKETLFTVTPPVARVDPAQTQLVRFLLTNKTPLKTERMARVIFDSIGERKDPNANVISVRIRQNLPVVIHPKGLPVNREPWKLLKWQAVDGKLKVTNDSPYVVRMGAEVMIMPMKKPGMLPNTYLLPGQSAFVLIPKDDPKAKPPTKEEAEAAKKRQPTQAEIDALLRLYPDAVSVNIQPATSYGYMAERYDAKIETIATATATASVPASTPAARE